MATTAKTLLYPPGSQRLLPLHPQSASLPGAQLVSSAGRREYATLCGLLDVTTHWLLEGRVDEAMTHHGDAAYALHGRVQHMKATLEDLSRQIDELDKILDARLKDQ